MCCLPNGGKSVVAQMLLHALDSTARAWLSGRNKFLTPEQSCIVVLDSPQKGSNLSGL